jgi:hypothetical protein
MALPTFNPAWFEGVKWQRPALSLLDSGMSPVALLAARQREKWLTEARENTTGDEKIRRARAYLATIEGALGGAGGHDKLFYAACRLVKGFMLGADEALTLLLSDYNSRCQPEWSYEEIAHKVDDAVKQMGAEDGFMLVDTPEWVAKNKFWAETEYVQDEVDGPSGSGYEGLSDAQLAGVDGDESPAAEAVSPATALALPHSQPAAPPTSLTPADSDDVRQWRRLWADKGVNYDDIGQNWDRKKDGTGKRWILPPTTNNLVVVLSHSRRFAGRLAFNELSMGIELDRDNVDDMEVKEIHGQLGLLWNDEMVRERVRDAVERTAYANSYDPWRQFAASLPAWDGGDHLASFISDILGFDASIDPDVWQQAYTEWRHQLTGSMARNMVPGTKMETILILVGGQGRLKSTLLRELFNGRRQGWDFFTDQDFDLRDKDGLMLIGRFPCCEWGEAQHAKNPTMIDRIKSFLARRTDVYRPPYGKTLVDRERRVVFFGTSNEGEGLLHDVTGNRRFYICNIGCRDLDLNRLAEIREQLWAQIRDIHRRHLACLSQASAGDSAALADFDATRWWYTTEEEKSRADSLRGYLVENQYDEFIAPWVESRRKPFTMADVVREVLGIEVGQLSRDALVKVRATLTRLDCKFIGNIRLDEMNRKKARWWQPPEPTDEESEC